MRTNHRKTSKDAISRLLDDAIGQRIIRFNRIFYEYQGKIDQSSGELEIVFERFTILFGCFSDGQTLAVSEGRWIDSFQEPLSPENRNYVQTHGKWTRFDVSQEPAFSPLIQTELETYRLLENVFGILAGIELCFEGGSVFFAAYCDEEIVDITMPDRFRYVS